jgi:hypothetical protein
MRRAFLGLAAALTMIALLPPGQALAQIGGIGVGADPFSFYYGYYLPHQAAMAATPTPLDTINQVNAQRQVTAQTDRTALYDPISPYGAEEDPFSPYAGKGRDRSARGAQGFTFSYGAENASLRGNGPATYYNRVARYYPGLRTGRGPNQNLARVRTSRAGGMGMGGGMGMPGMPGGMPGIGPR